jgi:enoyl-[acyl-carrier-protein] reductase (NADH)
LWKGGKLLLKEKVADPIEVAKIALFFTSYLSDHMTGEHLLATGGDVMSQ